MRFVKGLFSLLLVSLLLIPLAACNDKGTTSTTAPAGTTTGTQAKKDYSQRVKYTMATVQTIEGLNYTTSDAFAKFYSDKYNYDIEVTALTFDNWAERLRVWINSGDMPDVCVFDFKYADAATFVEQELVKKMPDDWKTLWPNIATVFSRTTLGPKMEEILKGVYFLPRARFDKNLPSTPLGDHLSMWLRKDWAEAVNFPIKSTYKTSEIIEYGNLIKKNDPGKVGDKLQPISNRPHWAVELFIGSNSTHFNNFYKDDSGKYVWGAASQDTLTGLKLYQEAYKSGALNKEFYTLKDIQDYDQFRVSAVSGGYFGEAPTSSIQTNFVQQFQANTGKDPDKSIHVATVLGEDGNYHQEDLINYWGTVIFNPKIDKVKFERYMDILDYNCTEEGYLKQRMGFEGTDYTVGANKELTSLLKPGESLSGKTGRYPSMGYVLGVLILADDFAFNNPNIKKDYRDLSWNLYTERKEKSTDKTFTATDWDLYCYDSPSMRKVAFDYDTELTNLVTTQGDLETNWKNWIKAQAPLVDPVLKELNAIKK